MPNTNCLEGLACPECGQETELHVVASMWVSVKDEGTDSMAHGLPSYDTEWDDDTDCRCPECGYLNLLRAFRKTEKEET